MKEFPRKIAGDQGVEGGHFAVRWGGGNIFDRRHAVAAGGGVGCASGAALINQFVRFPPYCGIRRGSGGEVGRDYQQDQRRSSGVGVARVRGGDAVVVVIVNSRRMQSANEVSGQVQPSGGGGADSPLCDGLQRQEVLRAAGFSVRVGAGSQQDANHFRKSIMGGQPQRGGPVGAHCVRVRAVL